MARRGVFGRLPRSQPSLTATIISIAEQMLADQDRNVMEAWQNGGEFEGKPVTDRMVLQHWQQRLKGVSRSDPLYDTYRNNVTQLEYKIAYSKRYTGYLQGGRTDNLGMAKFFTDWAQKVPRNSEFYRTLQQDAAGYVNLARSAARAGAAQAKVDNFNSRRLEIDRQYILPANIVNDAALNYARANGLIGNNQTLESLDPTHTAHFYDLLANSEANTFLYNGPNGRPVTVGDVRNQVHKVSPELRFGFTAEDINRMNLRAVKGSTMEIRLARQNGYDDWTSHYQTQRDGFGRAARDSGIMSVEDQYVHLRETFNVEFNDPTTGIEDKAKAWEDYQTGLKNLARRTDDPNTQHRLAAEANGDTTQNSLAEDVFGFGGPPGKPPDSLGAPPPNVGDIASMQMLLKLTEEQHQIANDGTGIWTNGYLDDVTNAAGQVIGKKFVPSANGTVVGLTDDPVQIATLAAIDANGNPTGPVVTLTSPWGGKKDVYLHLVPVYATGVGTATAGQAAPSTYTGIQAATIVVNGVAQTSYLYTNNGQTWKTPYAPWDPSLPVRHLDDGSIQIDASSLNVTGPNAAAIAQAHPDAFALQITGIGRVDPSTVTYNPDGTVATVVDPATGSAVPVGPGQLVQVLITNVPAALYATDPTRASGPSPTEDFKTWTQAMLTATPGGQQEYDKLAQDKGFQQRLASEIAANSTDPVTGLPNPNVQAAANLQAFGSQAIPGFNLVASTPLGHTLFNWFINRKGGPEGNVAAGPAAAINQQAPQPQALAQSAVPIARPTPAPTPREDPSLSNVGWYTDAYQSLVRLGFAPPVPARNDLPAGGHQPVTIAPANIKVPEPPRPLPAPAPAPPTPVQTYGPPVPPPTPIYGRLHAGQGGQ